MLRSASVPRQPHFASEADLPEHEFSGSRPGSWLSFDSSRVAQARYDSGLQQVHVVFVKHGTPWTYDSVPPNVWRNFRRSSSPGKYINRVLNNYPYWEGAFDYGEGGVGEET